MQFSINFTKKEIEKALFPSCFDAGIDFLSTKILNEEKVYIIPQDAPNRITEASWAFKDFVLQDIMELQDTMKCIVIGNSLSSCNFSTINKEEPLVLLKGICIDYGGENYIAYPLVDSENGELEQISFNSVDGYLKVR